MKTSSTSLIAADSAKLLEHTPNFSVDEAVAFARNAFGVAGTAEILQSERDQNFLIRSESGSKYVLKIANALEDRNLLIAQQQAMSLIASELTICPKVISALSGESIAAITSLSGSKHLVRLVTYLDGTPVSDLSAPSSKLHFDLGRKVAMVDGVLATFAHPALHRDFHWDLANAHRVIEQRLSLIENDEMRGLVSDLLNGFKAEALPLMKGLRQSVIHNDANSDNVIVYGDEVVGLIDFGDMVHSYTIAGLAIAIAYAILDEPDPLKIAVEIVKGYNYVTPIEEREFALLWRLVQMRLCMSICIAADQRRQRPDNEYLNISQDGIAHTLPVISRISTEAAVHEFRRACGTLAKSETLRNRRQRLGGNLRLSYKNPVKIVRGSMQYIYDESGRRYLDAYNNVPHVGHCHTRVVRAAYEQMSTLSTNTRYLHDRINEYAEKLCSTLPASLNVCYFVNSGSEANELALRLARAFTGARDLIVLEDAYHGNTTTMIDISPYKHAKAGGSGAPPWVYVAPLADGYRGEHKYDDISSGQKYAASVETIIDRIIGNGGRLCGYIAESLPSVGGQIVFPTNYLPGVYSAVRSAGGVCIADEVQTGYGRVGTHFWGFEKYGVVPDIVVLGKPIGNGHPIGAVVTTREIADAFDNGIEFFSTFGGNTVSCAIGLEVLNVALDEDLQRHALRVGNHLLSGLNSMKERYEIIGDVRGSGLFIGIELVKDRETLEPAVAEASRIINALRGRGILIGTEGRHDNVLKIRPPMPFTSEDADLLLEGLDDLFKES